VDAIPGTARIPPSTTEATILVKFMNTDSLNKNKSFVTASGGGRNEPPRDQSAVSRNSTASLVLNIKKGNTGAAQRCEEEILTIP
jgi:hypothetical protein